jgi:hypothetical protein
MNPVNMNPGNWGVNPAYLTPSYTAPFRPPYSGPYGTPYGAQQQPGFWQSMNATFNPIGPPPNYGGNSYNQNQAFYSSMAQTPTTAMLNATQKLAVPMASAYAAFKYTSNFATSFGEKMGAGLLGGALGPGAARFGASAGAFASSWVLPPAIAQAGVSAFGKLVAEPYIVQTQLSNALRNNFSGISYSGSIGNNVTGRGLNREYASGLSRDLTSFGIRDFTFNAKELADITDNASRAGLFDFTSSDRMASKAKSIARQVKTVMQIANTSDFREAIELLSRFQTAGAVGHTATSALSQIGGFASAAGTSAQRLINTVGSQGQYLYGSNGFTPYLGQVAAAQSYSAFANAARSGYISPSLMARMGGVEGATQSSLTGHLNSLQTPYAQMLMMNAAVGGGIGGGLMSNLNRFGTMSAGDPIQTLGYMGLHRGTLQSSMAKAGPGMTLNMAMQIAGNVPGMVNNGKITAEKLYAVITSTGMMGPTEAEAFIAELTSYQDEGSYSHLKSGLRSGRIDEAMKFADQQGLARGIFTKPLGRASKALYGGMAHIANGVGLAGVTAGSIADSIENTFTRAFYPDSTFEEPARLDYERKDYKNIRLNDAFRSSIAFAGATGTAGNKIYDLVEKGDKDALKLVSAMESNNKGAVKDILYTMSKKNKLGAAPLSDETLDKLHSTLMWQGLQTVSGETGTAAAKIDKVLSGIGTLSNNYSAAEKLNTGVLLADLQAAKSSGDHDKVVDITEQLRKLGGDYSNISIQDAEKMAGSMQQDLAKTGGSNIFDAAKKAGFGDISSRTRSSSETWNSLKAAGLTALTSPIGEGYDWLDPQTIEQEMKRRSARLEQENKLDELYKAKAIDTTSYNQAKLQRQEEKVVEQFDDAVTRFVAGVNTMNVGRRVDSSMIAAAYQETHNIKPSTNVRGPGSK